MANKQVKIGNVTYLVPENYDPSIALSQQEIEKGLRTSIDEGIRRAADVPRTLQEAQGAALLDVRRGAARTLQAARGLARSGRGLGIARDVSLATDLKSGRLRGEFATQVAAARQAAAAAKTEGLLEKGKLLEAERSRKAAASRAQLRVEEIKRKFAGDIYTTSADRQRMITELKAERDAAVDPDAARTYQNAIDELEGGTTKGSGTLDLPF